MQLVRKGISPHGGASMLTHLSMRPVHWSSAGNTLGTLVFRFSTHSLSTSRSHIRPIFPCRTLIPSTSRHITARFLASKATTTQVSNGVFSSSGKLIKQVFWMGLGLGTVVSAVGIAWSPSYRELATIYSAALFRSVATFVTGYGYLSCLFSFCPFRSGSLFLTVQHSGFSTVGFF